MPTTRSSHRHQPPKQSTGAKAKRSSDNSDETSPAKRGKLSNQDQDDEKNPSHKKEVKSPCAKVPDQIPGKAAEDKASVAKKDEGEGEETPSYTLETGIIYFFYRGRVDVEDPQGIEDVARSYIVLRPLDPGAKVGETPLNEAGNARLLALPKKMLPKKHGDGFLAFVEKASCSIKDLREQFSSSEYETKTAGTRHIPAATPFAEGVYSITSTDQQSHLAYQIKVPEIGDVQNELGVHEKGRYIVSVKNPEYPGPGNVPIGNPPEYSQSTQDKFEGLRWIPLTPELLGYDNTQLLVIGEALHPTDKPVEGTSETHKDYMENATKGDWDKQDTQVHRCVAHFRGYDPVFADLETISKEYPKMQTTW